MNMIIHDLTDERFQAAFSRIPSDTAVISDNGAVQTCVGCFGCWIKTPGVCVLKDGYENMGALLSRTNRLIIISECCFGGYSPFVKTVLDRSISYLLPFFKTIDNETHHQQRYRKDLTLSVYFYGRSVSPHEIETANELVKANSRNFYISDYKTAFYEQPEDFCYEEDFLQNNGKGSVS